MKRLALASLFALVPTLASSIALGDAKSEEAAAQLLHKRLQNENPSDAYLLRAVHGKNIVVVAGSMDHIEQVLAAAHIQYTVIQPAQVAEYQLRSNMIVMVNCPGVMPNEGVQRIARFVRAGGLLYTTDWSLKNVVEKAFPGTIAFNQHGTGSEVVPVVIDQENDNLMSNMLLRKGSKPQWWLEGGSYPIKILDSQRVQVLAHSEEMGKRYGAKPVVVRFKVEDGEVIHVVSHFYRQMGTAGPAVAAAKTVNDFDGLTEKDKAEFKQSGASTANSGDVESSYAFQRMTSNLVTGKQKRNVELNREYGMTPKGTTALRAAPAAGAPSVAAGTKGTRMKVLDRKGDQVRVRDEMGNEGWLGSDAIEAFH